MNHDDDCRCMGCCAGKFKTIDPALFGKVPKTASEALALLDESDRAALQRLLRDLDRARGDGWFGN